MPTKTTLHVYENSTWRLFKNRWINFRRLAPQKSRNNWGTQPFWIFRQRCKRANWLRKNSRSFFSIEFSVMTRNCGAISSWIPMHYQKPEQQMPWELKASYIVNCTASPSISKIISIQSRPFIRQVVQKSCSITVRNRMQSWWPACVLPVLSYWEKPVCLNSQVLWQWIRRAPMLSVVPASILTIQVWKSPVPAADPQFRPLLIWRRPVSVRKRQAHWFHPLPRMDASAWNPAWEWSVAEVSSRWSAFRIPPVPLPEMSLMPRLCWK